MKDVKYQTIRTVLNANKKLVETKANTIPLTHLYRTSQSYTGHLNLISWYHIYICTFVFDTSVGIMYVWIRLVLLWYMYTVIFNTTFNNISAISWR